MVRIPHSESAEQAVIGILLVGQKDAFETLTSQVAIEGLFYDERHKEIFNRVQKIVESGKPLTLRAIKKVVVEFTIEDAYLDQLESDGLPESFLPNYLTELLEYRQRRRAAIVAVDLAKRAPDPNAKISEILDTAENDLFQCRFTIQNTAAILEIVNEAMSDWDIAAQNPGKKTGIESGFHDFDNMTWGLQPGNLVIIGARPSQGKTAFLCNIAENVLFENKIPTLIFSLEMSRKELVKRMICSAAQQDSSDLRSGKPKDTDALKKIAVKLSKLPLIIEDRTPLTINQMRSIARRHVSRNGVKLILVDYLQKIKPTERKEKRTYEVAQVSEGLKEIAKDCNVPVIAACQLNRDSDKDKPRAPRPSDLGDSGAIERDADIIASLYRRPKDEQKDGMSILYSLLVQKHRDGPTGSVRLKFFKEYTRFEGMARTVDDSAQETML